MPMKQNGHNYKGNVCGVQESILHALYHIYEDIPEAIVVEKTLVCISQPGNNHNQYAMAMEINRTVKGHLAWKVSHVYILFLKKGGCS